jgi:hypothetical protein
MHDSVSNRVETEISSLKPARLFQHLHHAPDRLSMSGDLAYDLCNQLPIAKEHQPGSRPDCFD